MASIESASAMAHDERGEVFPVAILFGGVLLTILIGVHVVLHSIASTAVQAAADRGVVAAQSAPVGAAQACPPLTGLVVNEPESEPRCQGGYAVWAAMNATSSMVGMSQPPAVTVDNDAGVVSVIAFGAINSPVLGQIEVIGRACGPLALVEGGLPSRADWSAC